MSERPVVDVIIATRDRPRVLERAVRSALAQTYTHIEVVVADDGSDPPVELPEDLAARVRLVRIGEPRGAGAARNEAVRRSSGLLLAFLDDDDEWFPGKIERQVEVINLRDDAAAVECGYEMRRGRRLLYRHVPVPDRDLRGLLLRNPVLTPSTMMMRRAIFEELGGFDARAGRCEDWDLWVRLADRHRVARTEEVLARRWDLGELRPEVGLRDYRLMLERLAPRIEQLPPAQRARLNAYHTFNTGVWLARAGDRTGARAALMRAWREDPVSLRPLVHVVRTFTGERLWESAVATIRDSSRRARAALGLGDPWLRRW